MNRSLSDSWTGFTKILESKEKPPNGCMWSGERLILDDYWNVDSSKHLSDSWRGFHKNHSFEREASKRIHVAQRVTDKDSNDYQTRSCMARCMEKW